MPKIRIVSTVGLKKTINKNVKETETVGNLKKSIAAIQALTDSQIDLTFHGKVLDKDKRIKEYGIKDGDTLMIVPTEREGGLEKV
jgi:uncharacterized ubiquitin-like protein YukD